MIVLHKNRSQSYIDLTYDISVPRILEFYSEAHFRFSENFLRITFPNSWVSSTPQVEMVLMLLTSNPISREEFQTKLKLMDKKNFVQIYLTPLIKLQWIEMTIPEKPNSRLKKYRLTQLGIEWKAKQR